MTSSPDRLRILADEFVARHIDNGRCGWCGGLPHTTSCLVGRFVDALQDPAVGRFAQLEETVYAQTETVSRVQRSTVSDESAMHEREMSRWDMAIGRSIPLQEADHVQPSVDRSKNTPDRSSAHLTHNRDETASGEGRTDLRLSEVRRDLNIEHVGCSAVPGARPEDLIERLERHYDFQCEDGPLRNCVEWIELTARLRGKNHHE